MPTYASLFDLKAQSLTQFLDDADPPDVALIARLDQAEAMVNAYLGLGVSLATAAASAKTVYGEGTRMLLLPPHTDGSVTAVTTLAGYTVPSYTQQNGYLVTTDSTGMINGDAFYGLSAQWYNYGYPLYVWHRGLPYTVTASYGHSTATLAILKAVTLDIATQLWRYKEAGGSETIGAEGGVTTVRSGLTALHKLSLDGIRGRLGQTAGVY